MASSSVVSMTAGMQAAITQLRTEKNNLEAEATALKAKTEHTQNESLSFIEKRDGALAENEDLRRQFVSSHACSDAANKTQLCFLSGLDNDAKEHAPEVKSNAVTLTVANAVLSTLAIDDALQAFEERAQNRVARWKSNREALDKKIVAKHTEGDLLQKAKDEQSKTFQDVAKMSDHLVSVSLDAKAVEDKLRTSKGVFEKIKEETVKLTEQIATNETKSLHLRESMSAQLMQSQSTLEAAEADFRAKEASIAQLKVATDMLTTRQDELLSQFETERKDFSNTNMYKEIEKEKLMNLHVAHRLATESAQKKVKTLQEDAKRLAVHVSQGESSCTGAKEDLEALNRSVAEAIEVAQAASSAKQKLESEETDSVATNNTNLENLKSELAELSRTTQSKAAAIGIQADEEVRAKNGADDAEAESAAEDKATSLCIQAGAEAAEAHEAALRAIVDSDYNADALAAAEAASQTSTQEHTTLTAQRAAAEQKLAQREAAAVTALQDQLAAQERAAVASGPGASEKQRILEDLKASLKKDDDAFVASINAEKAAGKAVLDAKKAEVSAQSAECAEAKAAADKECKKVDTAAKTLATKAKQLHKKLAAAKKAFEKHHAAALAAKEALHVKTDTLASAQAGNDPENEDGEKKHMDADFDSDSDL